MNLSGQPAPDAEKRPGVPAAEAFEGLPITSDARLEGARISPLAATTLRAALDLLLGDVPPRRPIEVTADDGALEVRCPIVQPEALSLAGGLMETIDGSLGPSHDERPEWLLRVPVHGIHALYLMLQQGSLSLALPWHSVVRVRMVAPDGVSALARRDGSAVLSPFVSLPVKPEARPAVLVGLGLKRAYLPADRLIWRMPAETIEGDAPAAGLPIRQAVRTSSGEVYWAVDPTELLAQVEPIPLPRSASPLQREPAPRPEPRTAPPSQSAPRSESKAAPPSPPARAEEPPMRELLPSEVEPLEELGPESVEPLAEPAPKAEGTEPAVGASAAEPPLAPEPPPAPQPPPAPEPPLSPEPPPAPEPEPAHAPVPVPAGPRALVAEDSIIGRIFLERLLQRRGFSVESVGTARELAEALAREGWDLVMADVDLPDASRAEHLRQLAVPGRWVALVRDAEDEEVARRAGILLCLKKPFESDHLDRVLSALGGWRG
jgi:CheY-like chemotaxis protein